MNALHDRITHLEMLLFGNGFERLQDNQWYYGRDYTDNGHPQKIYHADWVVLQDFYQFVHQDANSKFSNNNFGWTHDAFNGNEFAYYKWFGMKRYKIYITDTQIVITNFSDNTFCKRTNLSNVINMFNLRSLDKYGSYSQKHDRDSTFEDSHQAPKRHNTT